MTVAHTPSSQSATPTRAIGSSVSRNVAMICALIFVSSALPGCASTSTRNDSNSPQPKTEANEGSCQTPIGFIADGHSKTGYRQPVAQGSNNCEQGELTCSEGQWTGAYIFPSCTKQR